MFLGRDTYSTTYIDEIVRYVFDKSAALTKNAGREMLPRFEGFREVITRGIREINVDEFNDARRNFRADILLIVDYSRWADTKLYLLEDSHSRFIDLLRYKISRLMKWV